MARRLLILCWFLALGLAGAALAAPPAQDAPEAPDSKPGKPRSHVKETVTLAYVSYGEGYGGTVHQGAVGMGMIYALFPFRIEINRLSLQDGSRLNGVEMGLGVIFPVREWVGLPIYPAVELGGYQGGWEGMARGQSSWFYAGQVYAKFGNRWFAVFSSKHYNYQMAPAPVAVNSLTLIRLMDGGL